MKIVAARMNHETNTFSPVPTPLAAFGPDGPTFGDAALTHARGTRTGLGAFIDAAESRGDTIVVAVNATANPSGRVHDDAFEALAHAIVDAVQRGCDLILLDLHGAMTTQSVDDGEGELLRRVRAVAPDTPLAVALDLHGNISETIVTLADIVVGFKTYPHVDMHETGAHVARLAFEWMDGGAKPVVAWARPPLLSHTLLSATGDGAMQRAVQQAQALEADGLLAASIFAGFSLADTPDTGMSVVTVGRAHDEAQAAADAICSRLWADRDAFVYASLPLAESVVHATELHAAKPVGAGPVLLLDHGDNVMSGGSCDTTTLLEECLRQGLTRLGVGPITDPVTVARCIAAGVGSRVTVELGNRTPLGMPGVQRGPLQLDVQVQAITDGRFLITGPIYTGETWAMGRSVVLVHEAGAIVVTERPMEPLDLGVFTSVGLDPLAFDFLLLKSRMYCRPSFAPLSCGMVECDSGGVTASDYRLFHFERLRRPLHPIDPHQE